MKGCHCGRVAKSFLAGNVLVIGGVLMSVDDSRRERRDRGMEKQVMRLALALTLASIWAEASEPTS